MMRLEIVTWLVTLVTVTSAQSFGAGREYGRINGRLQGRHYGSSLADHANQRRDSNHFDGNEQTKARWAGHSALRDNQLAQNEQALRQQAQQANQNFGRFSNNFGNIAKQIRDEALRNQYVIKDDAQYKRNNLNSAKGANQARARKTAFNKGDQDSDKINYVFNKKFDKASSENGGYKEENGRNLKKVNLLDEREKDRKLINGDSQVSRAQSDQQRSAKDQQWNSNAAQRQAQAGKYGFADRRAQQLGERSDDRAVDYDRKDSRYLEQETGKDEAVRLAKDLAAQQAGYNNEATATADANRAVADKKYYGGKELGANPALAGQDGYGPENAAQASAAVSDKSKHEGSGGAINSGFDENAAQLEKGNELAAAKALSSAEAINDYQRNKDKLAYDQVRGLQDRSQGQFKKGLQDAASQGFSGNNAAAAKSASEWDKAAGAAQSASNLEAKERNEQEALRDRNYYRKIQNDDSETFTRRKQFFHNKKEGGVNDENLKFNRNKNGRKFGAADEADLAKQNRFRNLNEEGKVASQKRNFEDLIDRRNSLQNQKDVRQGTSKGFDNKNAKENARAHLVASGFDKALEKSSKDDSQSQAFNNRQSLQDQQDAERRAKQDQKDSARVVAVDLEYIRPTNSNPLGDISARDFISSDLVRDDAEKGSKKHKIPDVIVDIKPIDPPPKIERPKQIRPLPDVPAVQQVKTYTKPKYTKPEVNYDTGRPTSRGNFNRPTFSRIDTLSFFKGPRQHTFNTKQQATPKRRFNLNGLGHQNIATSSFGRNLFGHTNNFNRVIRGNYGR